jgi:hypothetical protein
LKRIFNWKTLFALSVIVLFLLLFSVLYFDTVRLPESGFSRGIEITRYDVTGDFKDYYAQNAFVFTDQKTFTMVFSDLSTIHMSQFDMTGAELDSRTIDVKDSILQMNGHLSEDGRILQILYQNKTDFGLYEASFSTESGKQIGEAVLLAEKPRKSHIGKDHLLYADDQAIYLYRNGKTAKIADVQYVETLTSYDSEGILYLTYTYFDQNYYRQILSTADADLNVTSSMELHEFMGTSSTLPTEIALFVDQRHFYTTTVFKDKKGGTNIIYFFDGDLSKEQTFETKSFNSKNYSLSPNFYKNNDQVFIAYSLPTSIGRVDIDTAGGQFTNLVTSAATEFNFKSLTKTIHPSIKPLFFSLENEQANHQYFVYTETSKKQARIFISSNEPDMIKKSASVTSKEFLNLLMTTLTTFLPLSYLGLILEVYVLVPILVLVLIASMFYITWTEKNGSKLLRISIGIHIAAKFLFVYTKILSSPEKFVNFPFFLDTPFKLFGWGVFFTVIALICTLNYLKRDHGVHYTKAYFFFNVIDLVLFVMLYTPYLFIS